MVWWEFVLLFLKKLKEKSEYENYVFLFFLNQQDQKCLLLKKHPTKSESLSFSHTHTQHAAAVTSF